MVMIRRYFLAVLLATAPAFGAVPYRVTLGFLSWQDTFSVSSATATIPLRDTAVGISPGVAYELPVSGPFFADFGGSFILGSNDATVSPVQPGAAISYTANGATAYGFLARAGMYWRGEESPITVGVSVPLLFKKTSWPTPAGGFTVDNDSAFSLGFLIESRITRGDFSVTPRVGFLQSASRYLWQLELGYSL